MVAEVEAYLRQRRSMVLATHLDGEVRAASFCFAVGDEMKIYSFVFQNSFKHRGILQNPQVSVVVDDGFCVPMRGVEIIGTATIVEGAERRHAQELLTKRFPELAGVWEDPRILTVRVSPDRVRFTDWTHGVGQAREASITLRPGT
jgi:uncharacterized protein YhbP (UPF0306 family)